MKKEWVRSIVDDISRSSIGVDHPSARAERACACDLISLLPFNGDGMTVLDIGMDCGFRFAPLAFLNYRVFGIEPSGESSNASAECDYAATGVEVMRCAFPGESVPFQDGSFDWIILSNLPDGCSESAATVFSEIRRLMKPTSRMILKSHNPSRPIDAQASDKAVRQGEDVISGRITEERELVRRMAACPGELSERVEKNGFRVVLRMYRDYSVYCKPFLTRYICHIARFIRPRLCDTLVTVCTKK
ncbi:MAG: methyltransferase domain-containing protein [candidate division Zixibacteria bacterium]|nr:methyltransferase domain-containing protein [candidate division Zixibacteria bacterium]MBU1472144.1 methyltransferase domain-containing protein [candidate division Zixibacteria bacterium]MBU2625661.1 methyltransferase domain-containing protein [candidate division Zixibacteria bacterium]